MPPPITRTRPGATPGTPPSSRPRPPSGFSRKYAPACAARRPAISLIGASSGSRPSSVSTVSYATAVIPLSTSARVSGSSAAMCRYVNSTSPSRRREYSGSIGSLTLSSSSDASQTSSTETTRAPAATYESSENELPTPALRSTVTSCPRCTSSRAPAGVSATRYSSGLISFATPIFTGGATLSSAPAQKQRERRDGLQILQLVQVLRELVERPAHDLHVFVVVEVLLAAFEVLSDEHVHPLIEGFPVTGSTCRAGATVRHAARPPLRAPVARSPAGPRPPPAFPPAARRACSPPARAAAARARRCPRGSRRPPSTRDAGRSRSRRRARPRPAFRRRRSRREPFHVTPLLNPEPPRLPGARVLEHALGPLRSRNHHVDPPIGERPLQERLRPRLDAERTQRLELAPRGLPRDEAARSERLHRDHGDT